MEPDLASAPVTFAPSELRILGALENKETTFEYLDQPLENIIADISFRYNIPIVIDSRALEDYGIGKDTPVTISLRGLTLKSAFRLMLDDLDLTYVIENEVMQITTPAEAKKSKQIHVYKTDQLVAQGESEEQLVGLLTKMSEEKDTDMASLGQRLVVNAPFGEHQKIMRLLQALAR